MKHSGKRGVGAAIKGFGAVMSESTEQAKKPVPVDVNFNAQKMQGQVDNPHQAHSAADQLVMTTSGTTTFDLDVDELITEAYERCGLQARAGYDIKTARRSLNLMFLDWASRGLNLWTIEQRTLPLTAGTYEYDLPLDTVNVLEAVIRSNINGVQTDITLNRFSRAEWLHTPVKISTQSRPAQFYVQRTITPQVYFYPNPDDSVAYTFVYYAIKRIQDAGAYTDTMDINFRFLPCLASGLAYFIAMKRAPERMAILKQIYEEDFLRAAQEDRDIASVYLVPDRTMA